MAGRSDEQFTAPKLPDPQLINPSTMLFHFQMGDGECHAQLTGTCSLKKARATGKQQGGEAGVHYCQNLFADIMRYGFRSPIDVFKYRCGHYGFSDGQHRVCIAKRVGLNLPAMISTIDDQDCEHCAPPYPISGSALR
jgi:hypothetical protein